MASLAVVLDGADTSPHGFPETDRFELIWRLGSGGMGVVYEALDRQTNQRVAIKAMRGMSPAALMRFKDEFRALRDLRHPNLVQLGELFVESGRWFFTMELVDGCDFLAYVRHGGAALDTVTRSPDAIGAADTVRPAASPNSTVDESALRGAFAQLARGVLALHRAGKIHRDIKPPNIRVSREGRVVLLDFGLVTETDTRRDSLAGAGTPAYMAPEQAAGERCGRAADWYSVGVMLYEALTGRLPPRDVEPPAGAPADLASLCVDLLHPLPAERPGGLEILQRLSQRKKSRPTKPGPEVTGQVLVGRQREIEQLRESLSAVRRGASRSVFLCGENGSGKSAMLAELPRLLQTPGLLVLRGRCFEREKLPYRGMDGAIDGLVRELSSQPPGEVAALAPEDCGALSKIFPVAAALPGFGRAFARAPGELRARAFAALRELLTRLARRRPVVLALDDWQWADRDSVKLLRYILTEPDPPPLLFVAAIRSGAGSLDPALEVPGPRRVLHLSPLDWNDSLKLCESLGVEDGELAVSIADRSRGSPAAIVDLARYQRGSAAGQLLGADQALRARIDRLGGDARALLELLSVARVPVAAQLAAEALGAERERVEMAARELRAANLAVNARERDWHRLEPAHARVVAMVLDSLDDPTLQRYHQRVARALEGAADADPAVIARHHADAGDLQRAAQYTELAAEQAAASLAFERAAELYGELHRLSSPGGSERRRLEARLADALADAGRGREAAEHYLAAARGATPAEARAFRRRAADQLLRTGHTDEGLALAREVMAELGERLPASRLEAVVAFASRSVVARVRGTRFRARAEAEIGARDLERIDTLFSLTFGLGMVDTVYGAALQRRYLELSLRAGEPIRVARALAVVAPFEAAAGIRGQRRASRLWHRAAELAQRRPDSDVIPRVAFAAGFSALQGGRWRSARTLCDRAVALVRERGADVSGDLAAMPIAALWACYFLGEITELAARVPPILRDAELRGDRLGAISVRIGPPNVVHLVRDDPQAAYREVDDAMSRWGRSGFDLQRLFALFARCETDLYIQHPTRALQRLRAARAPLGRSLLWTMQLMRAMVHDLRGRVALAAAGGGGRHADARLREATAAAGALEREGAVWTAPLARMLRAGVAARRGEHRRAAEYLAAAVLGFDDAEMALHGWVARRRLAELEGGASGRSRFEEAEAWLVGQTIQDPGAFAGILAPW